MSAFQEAFCAELASQCTFSCSTALQIQKCQVKISNGAFFTNKIRKNSKTQLVKECSRGSDQGGVRPLTVRAARRGFGQATSVPAVEKKPLWAEESDGNLGLDVQEVADGKSRVKLTVTVPQNICERYWKRALKRLQEERKELQDGGKAQKAPLPEAFIISVLGLEEVKRATLEILMTSTASEAFAPVSSRMISNKYSQNFVESGDAMLAAFDPHKPFQYSVHVDLNPVVTWASPRAYYGFRVQLPLDAADPGEEAEKELQSLRKDQGALRVKEQGGFQTGEVAIMDLETTRVNEDGTPGEPILSCCEKSFSVDSESSGFMPGLVEGMLGMTRDQSRTFDLDFPQDWPVQALRGVRGRFTATCKELFVREVPELEDSLADKLVPGTSSIQEARDALKAKHNQLFLEGKTQAATMKVLQKLTEVCEVDVPESLVLEDAQQLFALHLAQIQSKYNPTPEMLSKISTEEQFQLFVKVQRENCELRVKQSLAIDDIYEREIETHVKDEELEEELRLAWRQFEGMEERMNETKLKEQAFTLLKEKKTVQWLIENADILWTT